MTKPLMMCLAASCIALSTARSVSAQVESGQSGRWYVSPAAGVILYEGDEEVKDGLLLSLRLGYDFNEKWSTECALHYAPVLDENTIGWTKADPITGAITTGNRPLADKAFGDTYAFGFSVQGLYYFTIWERLDPYLCAGAGVMTYGEKVNGETFDTSLHVGAGFRYHLNDSVSIRLESRLFVAGGDTEANGSVDLGMVWTWGGQ